MQDLQYFKIYPRFTVIWWKLYPIARFKLIQDYTLMQALQLFKMYPNARFTVSCVVLQEYEAKLDAC